MTHGRTMSHLRLLTQLRHMPYVANMSQPQHDQGVIPEWTLGWRMQRALHYAQLSVEQMAEEIGVSRSTISRWLNDRGSPSRGYIKLWALRTGVSLDWLGGTVQWATTKATPSSIPSVIGDDPPGTAELRAMIRRVIPVKPPIREPQMRVAMA